ncbi:hypothetical protein N7494_004658 [Penicillium frequentans]|uniref:Uncharacterized protein n=1 Tax=Penicillium frequentans TaxID=3151616 RepID=A0AAD6D3G6_9EURO|nr:hypothetical protein N7494_004658 [Penicillium glabrum]
MPATPISPSRPNSWSVPGSRLTEETHIHAPRSLSHPNFPAILQYLGQNLHPLVSCKTAQIPPDFPQTMLSYHLLTNTQLDDLAQYFHQISPPIPETFMYPAPIQQPWVGTEAEDVDLETKRRRFGRFIGLRGCDSPPPFVEPFQINFRTIAPITFDESVSDTTAPGMEDESVWEMMLLMEREWQAALAQAQAEQYHSFGWK